tara:strand:+ start:489 stop:683 length:195 start_codon:yes stop_codon:yes gene_type:complete
LKIASCSSRATWLYLSVVVDYTDETQAAIALVHIHAKTYDEMIVDLEATVVNGYTHDAPGKLVQ